MRYLVKLSYLGRDFHGWQVQPSDPSVQQALEDALGILLRHPVPVTGAGRTDAGVNAVGYIAHFDAEEGLDEQRLVCKLNAILPPAVAVLGIRPASPGFHARFDATKREYTYFLHRVKDPFVESWSYLYTYPGLDFGAMNEAAACLKGQHDFRCFEKSGTDVKTSICTVNEAFWAAYTPTVSALGVAGAQKGVAGSQPKMTRSQPGKTGAQPENAGTRPEDAGPDWPYWYFRISADRFLRNMVRAVVGTLLEVGRGKRSAEDFRALILDADPLRAREVMRSCAGESVPGHALFLSGVEYQPLAGK